MATITQVETILNTRLGPLLTVNGISVTIDSAIAWAIRECGGSTADITAATDAELAGASSIDCVLDNAELRTLMTVLQNITTVDWKAGPISEKSSQLVDWIKDQIEKLTASLSNVMTIGYIDLNIVEVG